jgi:ubiquinone/menaquinone biosynthesis C-methylase UbiE
MSHADFKKLIEEYSLDYCHYLEAVYGKGMLSEGGSVAIDSMFSGIDLNGKTALDIGSGMGGVDIYLARNFSVNIKGIDINAGMINESNMRIPDDLKERLSFHVYDNMDKLNFNTESFDIVFSKGVLTHVKEKTPLLKEIFRVLKPNGKLIINDWLSLVDNQWHNRLLEMCEIENLTLYAFSETTYKRILEESGFSVIRSKDETEEYGDYNQKFSEQLLEENFAKKFIANFGTKPWEEAHHTYKLIADSMHHKELLVKNFICEKLN